MLPVRTLKKYGGVEKARRSIRRSVKAEKEEAENGKQIKLRRNRLSINKVIPSSTSGMEILDR